MAPRRRAGRDRGAGGAGIEQREPMLSVPSVGARDPAVGEEAEVRETEHPLRPSPNSASIGARGTGACGSSRYRFHQPLRSDTKTSSSSGLHTGCWVDSARPSRHAARIGRAKVSVHLGHPELRPVPGHARVIPAGPRQPPPIAARPGERHRSRARRHDPRLGGSIQRERDELVRDAVGLVTLANAHGQLRSGTVRPSA